MASTDLALPVLVYDGDCAFCEQALRYASEHLQRLPPNIVRSQSLSDDQLANLGLTRADVAEAVWLVTRSRRLRGHEAIAAVLRMQPSRLRRVVGALAVVPPLSLPARLGYEWVAANRHRLTSEPSACATSNGHR